MLIKCNNNKKIKNAKRATADNTVGDDEVTLAVVAPAQRQAQTHKHIHTYIGMSWQLANDVVTWNVNSHSKMSIKKKHDTRAYVCNGLSYLLASSMMALP